VLGAARVVFLGYPDSGSSGAPGPGTFATTDVDEVAERLAVVLREEGADVLTSYDRHGGYGHPDHVHVHRVGAAAAERAGTPRLLEATISRELLKAGVELAQLLGYDLGTSFRPDDFEQWYLPEAEIDTVVDVAAQLNRKRAAMQAHASQATSSGGADLRRSLAVFASLPDDQFALAFGREWFVRCGEGGRATGAPIADDVFAGLPS
jgi:LmbE family N-acetylglucosaminyl deacetylase